MTSGDVSGIVGEFFKYLPPLVSAFYVTTGSEVVLMFHHVRRLYQLLIGIQVVLAVAVRFRSLEHD